MSNLTLAHSAPTGAKRTQRRFVAGIKSLGHDSGAAILCEDGDRVEVVAVAEERLSRVKHCGGPPIGALLRCLDHFGLEHLGQVDLVCSDAHFEDRLPASGASAGNYGADAPHVQYRQFYDSLRVDRRRLQFVPHIDCHVASSYFASGMDSAAVLSMDGGIGIYVGDGTRLQVIDKRGYNGPCYVDGKLVRARILPDDPCQMLSAFFEWATRQLGYDAFAAGTTMALSAFGGTHPRLDLLPGRRKNLGDGIFDYAEMMAEAQPIFAQALAQTPYQRSDFHLDPNIVNLARQVQEEMYDAMLELAALTKARTGATRLCLSGGSALSCVTNRRILNAGLFDELFIQPASSDEGIALGAALYGYHMILGGTRRWSMSAYLGKPNDPSELDRLLPKTALAYRRADPGEVARLIADGRIVGRVASRAEYGPRALGNRSILADPRNPDMVRRLNHEIKQRETFRPFAPSCLEEHAQNYFDIDVASPYMIIACQVHPHRQAEVPAITHVDGSARVQTVNRRQNEGYYNLLSAFHDLTGVPVLLNTSFNGKGEPIVETYIDALVSFLRIGLDHLYLDGYLIDRPASRDHEAALLKGLVEAQQNQIRTGDESRLIDLDYCRALDRFAASRH